VIASGITLSPKNKKIIINCWSERLY